MKNIISVCVYLLWPYAGVWSFTQTGPTENSVRTSRLQVQQQPSSKITLAADNELLLSSFNNLKEDEKYDTVLTGLCSKILDNPSEADLGNISTGSHTFACAVANRVDWNLVCHLTYMQLILFLLIELDL